MTMLKQRLEDLIKENKARAAARKTGLINQAPISKKGTARKKESPGSWKEKRERWTEHYKKNPGLEAPDGELANMIDGLTPDGYNKNEKKVSFRERGKDVFGSSERIAEKSVRISKS